MHRFWRALGGFGLIMIAGFLALIHRERQYRAKPLPLSDSDSLWRASGAMYDSARCDCLICGPAKGGAPSA